VLWQKYAIISEARQGCQERKKGPEYNRYGYAFNALSRASKGQIRAFRALGPAV